MIIEDFNTSVSIQSHRKRRQDFRSILQKMTLKKMGNYPLLFVNKACRILPDTIILKPKH
ncbi:MAG: hypothetical protein COY19_03225 [Candidatus Marinimicrobia bacterium CG_4_10_14_0_2_um_filter_48_9]|nr:MAG: hypothetical protein COY19_03225 [Candidatus Marinimicrobia bacterium CG_4_10_14_0_2_um_filter_48_9]